MLGPTINAAAIVICALAGRFLVRGVPKRFENIVMKAIALALIYIGVAGALENRRVLVLITSLVVGAVVGELLDINGRMNRLGLRLERRLGFGEGSFARGFTAATILFCTGSMAIVGSMQSGLVGNHDMLFAKSVLDGVIAIIFAAQMGVSVAFSAAPVLLYEGLITLCAGFIKGWLSAEIITEMSAVGSLLIAAIGFNFIGIREEIKVANLIPAIFMPWLLLGIESFF